MSETALSRTAFILALSCVLFGSAFRVQGQRLLTLAHIEAFKAITTTAISPDGSQILYTVEETDLTNNRRRRSIWIVSSTGGSSRKLIDEEADSSSMRLAWSPKGEQFAYLAVREGHSQVWLAKPSGEAATKLTNATSRVSTFAWSADGKKLAYVAVEPAAGQATAAEGIRVVRAVASPPKAEIHLVDMETGSDQTITIEGPAPDDLSWSPGNQEIAFSANNDIGVVATTSGKTRALVARPGVDSTPRWSPDGKQIAFVSNYGQTGAKISISIIPADGSGPPQDKYQALDFGFGGYPPRFLAWSPDSRSLYVAVLSKMTQNLYSLSLANGESKRITNGEGKVFHDFSFSRDGLRMALLVTDPLTPSEVYVSSSAGFEIRQLTHNTNQQLLGINLAKPEMVKWRSNDGTEIEGLLLRPPPVTIRISVIPCWCKWKAPTAPTTFLLPAA